MMHGVHAQQLIRVGNSDFGIGLIDLDFVLGKYYVNTQPVDPSTIFSNWGSMVLDASGLFYNDLDIPAAFQGTALALIAANPEFTVMVQYTDWVRESYVANYTGAGQDFQLVDYGSTVQDAADLGNNFRFSRTFATTYPNAGPHRYAASRTASRVASSVNGSAVAEDVDTEIATWQPNQAWVGGFGQVTAFPDTHIQQFLLLPLQSDAILQALSTVV